MPTAVAIVLCAVGLGLRYAIPKGPRIHYVKHSDVSIPTPALYEQLAGEQQVEPSRLQNSRRTCCRHPHSTFTFPKFP